MTIQKLTQPIKGLTIFGLLIPVGLCTSPTETRAYSTGEHDDPVGTSKSRITDEVLPYQVDNLPQRPRPLLEIGGPFLGPGAINQGIKLPTGAVWQPSFVAWGTYRTAMQTFDEGHGSFSEWANRLDLFGRLHLTFTERIVIGIRPLDRRGKFTGYTFEAPETAGIDETGFDNEFNLDITTLFFEGDFGEMFPFLDRKDRRGLDIGMAAGRQQVSFQDGILISDNVDAVGVTKINLKPRGAANYRTTFLWGLNELNRENLPGDDHSASLFGWFNEIDWRISTVAFDISYVDADETTGSGYYAAMSSIQRIGDFNTTFRVLGSAPDGDETGHNRSGTLLYNEISHTLHGSDDFVYLNGFLAIDQFRSASRDPSSGGPLGPTGVLYAPVGLGRYDSPLDSRADDAFGGALGWQMFYSGTRRQLVLELGGRYATEDVGQRAVAVGATSQAAFGRRTIVRLDGFVRYGRDRDSVETSNSEFGFGVRLELLCKL